MAAPPPAPKGGSPNIQASNVVSYKERTIKCRIDPYLPVSDVVQQLAQSFKANDAPAVLALRDENDALVTDQNLAKAVEGKVRLKLVSSPAVEAVDSVAGLQYAIDPLTPLASMPSGKLAIPLKLIIFNITKYLKEAPFADEFLRRGGLELLVRLITHGSADPGAGSRAGSVLGDRGSVAEGDRGDSLAGNTLAYALQSVVVILAHPNGWENLDDDFIDRLVSIVTTEKTSNVCRPAINILGRLVEADPSVGPAYRPGDAVNKASLPRGSPVKAPQFTPLKGKAKEVVPENACHVYGFDRICGRISQYDGFFEALVVRTEAGDIATASSSLSLINSLIRLAGTDLRMRALSQSLERAKLRSAVARLMSVHQATDLAPLLIQHQRLFVSILRSASATLPDFQQTEQINMLKRIWDSAQLPPQETEYQDGHSRVSWARLGLEQGEEMFASSGMLGLWCLNWYAIHERDFADIVLRQETAGVEAGCPVGRASNECIQIWLRQFDPTGSVINSHRLQRFQPFLMSYERLHLLVLNCFIKFWRESHAILSDFSRVSTLVAHHLSETLADRDVTAWHTLESALLETPYSVIRGKQIKEIEGRNKHAGQAAVSELERKLKEEVLHFVQQQRVRSMQQGSWFQVGVALPSSGLQPREVDTRRPWRFVKLTADGKTLQWLDSANRGDAESKIDLATCKRLDLSSVTEVKPQTSHPANTPQQAIPSQISLSLISGQTGSLLDLVATDNEQFAEWIDGLRVLFNNEAESESEMTRSSAKYLQALTDIGVQVRLLDMTAGGLPFGSAVPAGRAPRSTDFFFA